MFNALPETCDVSNTCGQCDKSIHVNIKMCLSPGRPKGELEGLYMLKWFDENTNRRKRSKGTEEEQRTDSPAEHTQTNEQELQLWLKPRQTEAAPLWDQLLELHLLRAPEAPPAACTLPLGIIHTLWHPDSRSVERSSKQRSVIIGKGRLDDILPKMFWILPKNAYLIALFDLSSLSVPTIVRS